MFLQPSDGGGLHSGSAQAISPLVHWHSLQGASLMKVSPLKYSMSPSKQLSGGGVVGCEVTEVEVVDVIGQIGLLVLGDVPLAGIVGMNIDAGVLT